MVMMFLSSALLYWMQTYCVEQLSVSKDEAGIAFLIIIVTSPLLGILTGGFIIQKLGGYKSISALKMTFIDCIILILLAASVLFIDNKYVFFVIMWLYLFFGAMIDPCISGLIVSSLPMNVKGLGYTINIIYSNTLGTSLSPTIFGIIYDATKNINFPKLTMTIILSAPLISLVLIVILIKLRKNEVKAIENEVLEKSAIITNN